MNLEDNYLSNIQFPITKDNYVVISGCSGGGKSTLLSELAKRGYQTVLEPGRQIVKEQTLIQGDALPWVNLQKFLDLALSRYLLHYHAHMQSHQTIFFDRGIVDAVPLQQKPPYFKNAADNFKYHRRVFLVPPWEELFKSDEERRHDFASAKKEFDELLIKYKHFGYETILIAKSPVEKRADFILETLGVSKQVPSSTFFVSQAKKLLEWNKAKLTHRSELTQADIAELFAPTFTVMANGRVYKANFENYYAFLNQFRADIASIDYQVQDYLLMDATVIMPLTAKVKRLQGREDLFHAIMLVKYNEQGKIVHWQEVYYQDQK